MTMQWNPFRRKPDVTWTYPANGGPDGNVAMQRWLQNTALVLKHDLTVVTLPSQRPGDVTVKGHPKRVAAFRAEKEAVLARERAIDLLKSGGLA